MASARRAHRPGYRRHRAARRALELITIASAAAVDTLRATSVLNEHDEVIITTSIMDGDRYLLRTSDIYYINDADSWQYRQPAPAAEIRLTGGHAAPVAAESPAPSL